MGVENEKYPNKSYAAKRNVETEAAKEQPRVQPVVSNATTKKTSFGSKLTALFIPNDTTDLKSYILNDIAIPAIKGFIQDAVDIALNGSVGGRRRSYYKGTGSYVSYGSYYGNKREPEPPRVNTAYQFENVILGTRGEAEVVMDNLYFILEEYQVVRVADLYDLCNIDHRSHTDVRFGWTSLEGAAVVRAGGGYMIKLSTPRAID